MDEQNVAQFDSESIAVVGMAARLPGAGDCGQFWDNLKGVVSSVREVPPDRWDADRYYSADSQDVNRAVSRWGGFIDGVDRFDPLFFGISPREARVMDPQQRILLELAWACVEDAGYAPDQLRGSRTGVFIGVMNADYRERLTEAAGPIAGHMSTGAYTALIPNRVSHFFDWHGPSLPVDTACSSSLVALHQALHALRGGECDQVLTGGVSVLCSPTHYVSFSKTGMLSPDGLCRTFDDRANGYVRSEGAGLLMLKPLSRALRDGDRVYGLIRGTAVNHGGKARTVTYPNPLAQAEVIATAHERAGVPPATVGYIEAHGTGTPKGDPIEIGGLKAAFERLARQHGQALAPASCGLGSLKANVGHLEPVAGVAGIIKVLLAMRHRTLPGLAHFQQLNHRIDLSDSPFFIVEKTQDWPQRLDAEGRALPRRAGVSSFGFGGVNAHAVVEEFLPPQEAPSPAPVESAAAALATLVVLSARTAQSLHEGAQRLLAWLQAQPAGGSLADVAYTLQVGRSAMEQRLALQADSVGDLQRKLAAFVAGEPAAAGVFRGEAKPGGDALAALAAEDVGRLVADWLAQGLTAKVLELWTRGLAVDWARLYGPRRPQRISLPTYAFARERHWVDAPHQAGFDPAAAGAPAGAAGLQYFQERWVEQPLSAGEGRLIRTLLCFASRAETRQALAQGLAALGVQARLLFVADAATGAAASATVAVVDRADAPSYARALERLQAAHGPADATLYLWALEDAGLLSDFAPILFLLQAAGATRICRGPVLLAAQGDGAVERCRWESLIGFERSAGNALGGAAVAAVYEVLDGAARPDAGALARWTRRLWDELQAPQPRSAVYVEGRRHACQLAPIDAEASRGGHAVPLRQGGTYLVTGGLGGLGRLFAQHLLRQWGANVVLAGRSPLDEARRGQLQALAQAGGQVLYVQADVADAAQMAQCLAALKARFGALHGVLHAAGLENWKSLQDCSRADFEQVLAPKVEGTLVLERLLREEPVDFLCCFSSSSAFVGDFGACSYAVGNRFQLALARLLRQRRPEARTLAIAWPLWQDGGMRVGDAQATAFYLQSTGQRLLQAGEGVAAFEALLSRPLDHALVMAGEPQRIRRLLKLDAPAAVPARPAAAPAAVAVAAHAAATFAAVAPPAGEPGAQALLPRVEQALLEMAAGILQVSAERLALDGNLADFGFDSINLAAFATALTRHYGIDVVPAVFFSYPTLERLARHLAEQHAPALQPLHGDAPPAAKAPVPPVAAAPAVPATGAAAQPRDGGDGDGEAAIAVIGMSGCFPGARDVGALWRLLDEGRSAVGAAPAERGADWAQAGYRCGFIDGVAEFDPLFFEISPREADHMDPRQRLLLQECWKALEDAGYGPARLQGRCVGTFVGIEDGDYHRVAQGAAAGEGSITSNHNGILAGRLAYFLDLDGPTLAINTACSSGLVALHQACLSLRNGECDTAIVAAANLLLTPHGCRDMEAAGMLSPTGACSTFDERADGMVPAEAVVVLVLKRLARARADEDRIHAVVAATGVNSDGRTNGITAPNGLSQARLIESVYRRHGIDPARIGCVVAHGTGTKLGDPVEVNALTQAFRALSPDAAGCALVSPKTNLGHALAASGLVSVVCLIEALRHEAIPASLNWERPNPFIHWQDSPFRVNDRKRPWPRGAHARMGAVSAFGMSGTNAHAVLREHAADARPAPAPAPGAPAARLFVLSAKTERALRQRIADMAAVFEHADAAALDDISHTLLERRHHFSHRCAFVAHGPAEAARLLRQAASRAQAPWCEGKVARGFRPQAEGQQRLQALLREHAAAAEAGDASRHQDALHALAGLYCEGYAVSGLAVPGAVRPRLASLPPYPFLAQHCWVRAAGPAEPAPQAVVPAPVHEPAPVPTRGFSLRGEAGTLLLVPAWDAVAPEDFREGGLPRGRLLLVGGSAEDLRALRQLDPRAQALPAAEAGSVESIVRSLAGQPWVDHVVWRVPQRPAPTAALEPESLIAAQADGVLCGLRLVQALHALGYGARPLGWTVLTVQAQSIGSGDGADPAHASVHGLMGSLAKEQPHWRIRLADLPAQHPVALSEVLALPADRRGHAWAYRHGEWYRRQLMPVRPVGDFRAPYRDQGVYIVIGGAGDIGQAWSEHLAARHGARIVWVGRRELDADIAARLESVARLGPAPTYIRADASRREELQAVRQAVLARHGAVHGVVHAAMVFANQELAGMTEPQFRAALAAKVDVSVRVAQVFGQDALDFLLFFSSLISLIKNPRQAHYAAGCTFKDAFAQQLARTASCPVKVVNWGYWAARKNADAGEVRQLAELGIGLIEPADGMKALDVLLASSLHQVGVMSLEREFEVEGMDGRATVDVYPLSPCPGRAVDDEAPLPAA